VCSIYQLPIIFLCLFVENKTQNNMNSTAVLDQWIPRKDELVKKAVSFATSTEGWEDCGVKEDVQITRRQEGPRFLMRGRGRLPVPMAKLREALQLVDGPKNWDALFMSNSVAEEKQDADGSWHRVLRSRWSSPNTWLVSNRDFVHYWFTASLPDGRFLSVFEICEHPSFPPNSEPNFVRGESFAAYVCVPVNDSEVDVTYLVSLDPKGSLPTWMVNRVAVDQPLNVAHIRSFLLGKPQQQQQ